MSEREESHNSQLDREGQSDGEEVVFREGVPNVESSTPSTHNVSPQMVTTDDLQEVIEGWKTKFQHLSEGIRAIQLASEKYNANMDNIIRDNRTREGAQERHIHDMQEGLARFLERCDPTHLAAAHQYESPCAPVMSMHFSPSGAPSRLRPDFNFESPVNQSAPTESTRDNRDHHVNRDHRYNERPTHEDDHGDSGDAQRSSNNSGMNNSASHPSSSPKVPIFDGTVSAQFRPWIIQFEAIARHQCWTLGERVVRLVASLTGPAANLLIGMTLGQLEDYTFRVARLSRRYDPPERGKMGHYVSECKTNGPKFTYAPKVIRMNYLQDASDNENDYSEGEQNNSVGND